MRLMFLVLFLICATATAYADTKTEVDLELVLLVDASNSIDEAETRFQRQGYADALMHPEVQAAIAKGILGRIAVTFMEWADFDSQDVVVPWTVIDSADTARVFRDKLMAAPRTTYGTNAIGEAIAAGQAQIAGNDIEGIRRVIDFSGDSANNWSGRPIEDARASALAAGTVINGLAILCLEARCSGRPVSYDLEEAFKTQIIGGPGSFVVTVDSRKRFAEAVRQKLILEIAGPPDSLPERRQATFEKPRE